MLIFAVDDEPAMLEKLHNAIAEAAPYAEIMDFMKAPDVLSAITDRGKKPDVVFSDIHLPGMDGLSLAARIKSEAPKTRIIFVSAFSQYALEAFRRHVSGYLMKPVDAEMIRQELDALDLPGSVPEPDRLRVQCLGYFDVFWRDEPLAFSRSKTKELFAYLIDRRGAYCTAGEIINALWESDEEERNAKNYLRVLINDLTSTLKGIGMSDVLLRKRAQLAIDCDKLDCDYYRMLSGDVDAANAFREKYMAQYSWAEMTTGRLYFGGHTGI